MSNSIISCMCWIKKNWARQIPLDYESSEDISKNKKIKKLSKAVTELKSQGKLTGNETIKESTKIIEENIDMINIESNDDNYQMPIFSEDLQKYYTQKDQKMELDKEGDEQYQEYFDDISDDEETDFKINPTDSLIICGTAQDDFSNLEIYIYDEDNLGLFVHHDITLTSFPLSLEWLPYKNNVKANYGIVGSFSPEIEIWNLDIMGVLEPEQVLGKGKNNIIDTSLTHTDAVMSLNLNPINNNIIASAGADSKILLWDLNSTPDKAAQCFKEHSNKVQSVKWNRIEDNIIASGSFDKTIKLFDIRQQNSSTTIKVNSDVECMEWSPLNKYLLLSSFENGVIELFDIRKFESILSFKAHKKEVTAVTFSNQQESLFCSVGRDCRIKVWDTQNIQNDTEGNKAANVIMEKFIKKSTGELFCCKFADDCSYTIAAGGSKGELYIWQLEESPLFCSRYGLKYDDKIKMPDELNNLTKKKKIANKNKKKK